MQVLANLALPIHPATEGQAIPGARQAVAGEGLQAVPRDVGDDALIILITADAVSIPCGGVPAIGQLTVHFQFQAFGGGALFRVIGIELTCVYREVVLLDAEQREAGVQASIQWRSLDTHFVACTFLRVQRFAVQPLDAIGLRVKDFRVAGVRRPGVVQVIHQPGIGQEYAMAILFVTGGRALVRSVVAAAFPVGDAAAQQQLEVIAQVPAAGGVGGVLVFLDQVLADRAGVRSRCRAGPLVDVADAAVVAGPWAIPAATVRCAFAVTRQGDAGDQLVLAAEQAEGAGEVGVQVVFPRCCGPAVGVQVGAGAGRLIDFPIHVVDQFVELVLGVAKFRLGAPAIVELVFERDEDIALVHVEVRPVWRAAGRAGEVGLLAIGVERLQTGTQR